MSYDLAHAPIESWDVSQIIPYALNNKKHPPEQIRALASSISETTLNDPITVEEDGTIIAGHGRFEAVKSLGWTKVPVRVLRGLDKDQAAKLRIAVNKTTSNDYDVDAMQKELNRLIGAGVKLDNMGLSDKELQMLIEDVGELNMEIAMTDVTAAIDAHERDVEETSDRANAKRVPLAKAFGFKDFAIEDKRVVTRFMAILEDSYGGDAEKALLHHMREVVDAST